MNINTILSVLCLIGVGYVIYLLNKKQSIEKNSMIFVDTSVLIDGRIVPIAKSGFITSTLAIPRSVVGELQFLADNADSEKRARARRGLDVVTELQNIAEVEVYLLQDGSKAAEGVDERLLNLAKKHGGSICTIDYNLNKVAVVEGIRVLNVNELAQSIRMAHLPGEKMMLEIVQKGNDSHQGVGYLSDGTMVVVEQASSEIGKKLEIEIIRSLQTAAGKMMFARVAGSGQGGNKKSNKSSVKSVAKSVVKPIVKPVVKNVVKSTKTGGRSQRNSNDNTHKTNKIDKNDKATAPIRAAHFSPQQQRPRVTKNTRRTGRDVEADLMSLVEESNR